MTPYRVGSGDAGLPSTAAAATTRNVAALVLRAWRLRVEGAELVPLGGPVLLVANHTGVLDAPVLAAASPRPVHVLARVDPAVAGLGRLLSASGQVAVLGDGPDRGALRTARGLLEGGGVVGVFPEGRRGAGDVRHVGHEAAYLAASSDAVVLPVAILGTRPPGGAADALPRLRAPLDVVVGAPVDVRADGDPRRRAVVARTGERLRQALADHVRSTCDRTGRALPGPLPDPPTPRSHP